MIETLLLKYVFTRPFCDKIGKLYEKLTTHITAWLYRDKYIALYPNQIRQQEGEMEWLSLRLYSPQLFILHKYIFIIIINKVKYWHTLENYEMEENNLN